MITFIPFDPEVLKSQFKAVQTEVINTERYSFTQRPDLFEDYTELLVANIHLKTGLVSSAGD